MSDRRDLRWNFIAAVIDACGWGVGMGLVSATTILPLFVQELTDSPVAVGMIQAVMLFGWLIPGILISGWLDRQPRVKPLVMSIAALERLVLLLMVPLTLKLGRQHGDTLLVAFFACWGVMNFAVGTNTPAYYKLIAKTIPPELRGRLYGIGGAVSGVVGVGAAFSAGYFLKRWGFPGGFAACFFAAFVVQALSVAPLGCIREPVQRLDAVPEHIGIRRALRLVREDDRLRWMVVAVAFFSLNQVAGGFYTAYAVTRFRASAETVAGFTAVLMGVRTVAFLVVGWVGDHHGNRAAVQIAAASGVGAAAIALGAPDLAALYVVFALNEVAVQGWSVCAMNYILELCPPERSGTYTAVYGLLTGPFRAVLPVFGGFLIVGAGYQPVFVAAVVGGMLSLAVLTYRVTEPRAALAVPAPAPPREALAEE